MDAMFLDFANDAFVGAVFLVFPAIGRDLKAHDLNQSLNFFCLRPNPGSSVPGGSFGSRSLCGPAEWPGCRLLKLGLYLLCSTFSAST